MLRRNPDALAIAVLGLFLMIANVPKYLIHQTEWRVRPLKLEVQVPKDDLRQLQNEIQQQAEELRQSLQHE